jgi:threonine 3-dehydrogenase
MNAVARTARALISSSTTRVRWLCSDTPGLDCCSAYSSSSTSSTTLGALSASQRLANAPASSLARVPLARLWSGGTSTPMKALAKMKPERGLWTESVDKPADLPHDHVLIKIHKASLCGTDLHIYNWDEWSRKTVPVPMVIGHEYSGVIAELGDRVAGLELGDRVTGEGHIMCGVCRNCRAGRGHLCRDCAGVGVTRPGAFAEYLSLPARNVYKLPAGISDATASIMDPLGNAVHCALSFDLIGEDVLITGAGPIGVMAAAVCKMIGARHVVVTDVNDYRLGLARDCGADAVVNISRSTTDGLAELGSVRHALGMKEGFDVALEMSGKASAYGLIVEKLRHGGKIAALGIPTERIPLDMQAVVFKGIVLKGIYGREIMDHWYKLGNLLEAGLQERVAPVITHSIAADDYVSAFDIMQKGLSGKIVMNWSS